MNKYNIIYADPPWAMTGGELGAKYEVMEIDDIKKLNINALSDDNCVLFLWCLNTRVPQAIDVMQSWGFDYKAVAFCWVKTSKSTGMPNCRLGSYTLNGMELCLLGLRGKMKREILNIRQVVMCPRGRHSAKPDVIRNEIVRMYGNKPRIELFARQKTDGWDVWGNEVKSDIELK